jgi:hypothetical protein
LPFQTPSVTVWLSFHTEQRLHGPTDQAEDIISFFDNSEPSAQKAQVGEKAHGRFQRAPSSAGLAGATGGSPGSGFRPGWFTLADGLDKSPQKTWILRGPDDV